MEMEMEMKEGLDFIKFKKFFERRKNNYDLSVMRTAGGIKIRFVSMARIRNREIILLIKKCAKECGLEEIEDNFKRGNGPSYIEYKTVGGDIVLAAFTNDSGSFKGEVFISFNIF